MSQSTKLFFTVYHKICIRVSRVLLWFVVGVHVLVAQNHECCTQYPTQDLRIMSTLWFGLLRFCTNQVLTHWAEKYHRHFPYDIFNVFSWMRMHESQLRFHCIFFPKGGIDNIPARGQKMAWRLVGVKPLSEPMMVKLPRNICVTRPYRSLY